jgi:surface protein
MSKYQNEGYKFLLNSDLMTAVNQWCLNFKSAEQKYGHISNWNTSHITNMENLFCGAGYMKYGEGRQHFNDDISRWDVSNVINMNSMFYHAHLFNQDISKWNVSNVTNMHNIFRNATNFNKEIISWNVENVVGENVLKSILYDSGYKKQPPKKWLDMTDAEKINYNHCKIGSSLRETIMNQYIDLNEVLNDDGSLNDEAIVKIMKSVEV